MRKISILLAILLFSPTVGVTDVGFGISGGVASYTDDVLPDADNFDHLPVWGTHFLLSLNSVLDARLDAAYVFGDFDYTPTATDTTVGSRTPNPENISFKDVSVNLALKYNFFKPDNKNMRAYIGGGFSLHFLTTDSDNPAANMEYLDNDAKAGLFAFVGASFQPNFSPVAFLIEGRYFSFAPSENTVGSSRIMAGLTYTWKD